MYKLKKHTEFPQGNLHFLSVRYFEEGETAVLEVMLCKKVGSTAQVVGVVCNRRGDKQTMDDLYETACRKLKELKDILTK